MKLHEAEPFLRQPLPRLESQLNLKRLLSPANVEPAAGNAVKLVVVDHNSAGPGQCVNERLQDVVNVRSAIRFVAGPA